MYPPAHRRARRARSRRSSTYDRDPYLAISTAACSGSRTPTRPATAIRTRTPAPSGINYIRNSVKVVDRRVSRHDDLLPGRPERSDRADARPQIFPGLLQAAGGDADGPAHAAALPAGRSSRIQAAMFATYHMTNPAVFYNKEDQWEIPVDRQSSGERSAMEPYYTIMKLPGEPAPEFIQMLPFTPRQQGQPGRLDGRAQRRRALRPAAWCSSSRSRRWCSGRGRSSRASTRTR